MDICLNFRFCAGGVIARAKCIGPISYCTLHQFFLSSLPIISAIRSPRFGWWWRDIPYRTRQSWCVSHFPRNRHNPICHSKPGEAYSLVIYDWLKGGKPIVRFGACDFVTGIDGTFYNQLTPGLIVNTFNSFNLWFRQAMRRTITSYLV